MLHLGFYPRGTQKHVWQDGLQQRRERKHSRGICLRRYRRLAHRFVFVHFIVPPDSDPHGKHRTPQIVRCQIHSRAQGTFRRHALSWWRLHPGGVCPKDDRRVHYRGCPPERCVAPEFQRRGRDLLGREHRFWRPSSCPRRRVQSRSGRIHGLAPAPARPRRQDRRPSHVDVGEHHRKRRHRGFGAVGRTRHGTFRIHPIRQSPRPRHYHLDPRANRSRPPGLVLAKCGNQQPHRRR